MGEIRPDAYRVTDAIQGGLEYLRSRRSSGASWSDFDLFGGESDVWVTAFTGRMLAETEEPSAREMADDALDWLVARPSDQRWVYSSEAPRDADSTVCVLRLADRMGRETPETGEGYAFVESHMGADGAVSTYQDADFRAKFGADDVDRSGWYSGHGCVTAAAATLPRLDGVSRSLQYLRDHQGADGSWTGYWWLDSEYTTAFAVEAFTVSGDERDRARIRDAARWVAERFEDRGAVETPRSPEGAPFVTALGVRLLKLADEGRRIRQSAVDWLVRSQRADGSWPSSAVLRVPRPWEVEPDESRWSRQHENEMIFDSPCFDHNRCLTTATVINVLSRAAHEDTG